MPIQIFIQDITEGQWDLQFLVNLALTFASPEMGKYYYWQSVQKGSENDRLLLATFLQPLHSLNGLLIKGSRQDKSVNPEQDITTLFFNPKFELINP